jgi:hypothetical protein
MKRTACSELNNVISKKVRVDFGCYANNRRFKLLLDGFRNPTSIKLRDTKLNRDATNAFGIDIDNAQLMTKKFTSWVFTEKKLHPDTLLAVQVGEFYEFWGIDALMCIEFGGLRAMGRDPQMRAGTPLASIQILLDSLVSKGLTIRVYDELCNDVSAIKKGKQRELTQVVCRSNPIFFSRLSHIDEDEPREAVPIVYILTNELVEVYVSTRTYRTVKALDTASVSVYVNSNMNRETYCVSSLKHSIKGTNNIVTTVNETMSVSDVISDIKKRYGLEVDDNFTEVKWENGHCPMTKLTCDQLGISSKIESTPSLVDAVMGKATFIEKQFVKNWLILKPTEAGRNSMVSLCRNISDGTKVVSTSRPLHPGKTYGVLLTGGGCKDIWVLHRVLKCMDDHVFFSDIHTVSSEYLGLEVGFDQYKKDIIHIQHLLRERLSTYTPPTSSLIPQAFIERNESHVVQSDMLDDVCKARESIENILQSYDIQEMLVYYTSENNIVVTSKTKPGFKDAVNAELNKGHRKCNWTTLQLQIAINEYIEVCNVYRKDQAYLVRLLCKDITVNSGKSMRILLNSEVITRAVYSHLSHVVSKGWSEGKIDRGSDKIDIRNCFPYWLTKGSSKLNNVSINNERVVILTAPNASGKTSIIRCVAATVLLVNCGFFAPAESITLPDIDNVLIRLPGSDRPTQGLSSFEAEVTDIQSIIERISKKTLVCFDEICRSTCPQEGYAIAQSIVEYLTRQKCYCIFSTHFLQLPVMQIKGTENTSLDAGHVYSKGYCTSSRAIEICTKYRLESSIISRTSALIKTTSEHTQESDKTKIIAIAKEITRVSNPSVIHKGTLIPPSLVTSHCVYIIEEDDGRWYCGETKNIINRRKQHQQNGRIGDVTVFPVSNKTVAQNCETLIQRACYRNSIRLSSYHDGNHKV